MLKICKLEKFFVKRFNRFLVPNLFNRLLKQINIHIRASWLEIRVRKRYNSLMIYENYHPQSLEDIFDKFD